MRVSLSAAELVALRNALATRREDLKELIFEYHDRAEAHEARDIAHAELAVIDGLAAKIATKS